MYGLQDWAAVQRVYKQTHSKRETARILKISRNTVKKLLDLKEEPVYNREVYNISRVIRFYPGIRSVDMLPEMWIVM